MIVEMMTWAKNILVWRVGLGWRVIEMRIIVGGVIYVRVVIMRMVVLTMVVVRMDAFWVVVFVGMPGMIGMIMPFMAMRMSMSVMGVAKSSHADEIDHQSHGTDCKQLAKPLYPIAFR